jgi:hypothetical protein
MPGLATGGRVDRHANIHDPATTGNKSAAKNGTALRDLMDRAGDDRERPATIYRHEATGAEQVITSAIDAHILA